jgi:hypothetical protein
MARIKMTRPILPKMIHLIFFLRRASASSGVWMGSVILPEGLIFSLGSFEMSYE